MSSISAYLRFKCEKTEPVLPDQDIPVKLSEEKIFELQIPDFVEKNHTYKVLYENTVLHLRALQDGKKGHGTRVLIDYKCHKFDVKPYIQEYIQHLETYKSALQHNLLVLAGPKGVGKTLMANILGQNFCFVIKDTSKLDSKESLEILIYNQMEAGWTLCLQNAHKIVEFADREDLIALLHGRPECRIILTTDQPSHLDSIVEPIIDLEPMDAQERLCFLSLMKPKWPNNSLKTLANKTGGFLYKDFECFENVETVEEALKIPMKPSMVYDHRVPIPVGVTWSDIVGIDDIRDYVRKLVEYPITKAEQYKALGLKPPKGILLHGPPGCSKTTIAKAMANASCHAFFSLNPASLYSAYVGESERIVREVFKAARQAAPSIIFVDELDTLVGKRATSGSVGADVVQERILSAFLNEMDGVMALPQNVMVLGATNRLQAIDKAILRPGRFDHIIEVRKTSLKRNICVYFCCFGRFRCRMKRDAWPS